MRIAVNTRFLLPGRLEGFGWYTHELLWRLVQKYPEHEYLFLFDRPYDPSFVYSDKVVPRVVFPPARHPLLFYAWFEYGVPRALEQWKADVFFSPDNFLSLSTKVPTLLTIHDVIMLQMPEQIKWIHRIYYDRYQRQYIARANRILTISEYVKSSIMATCGTHPDKIRVAYNGCRTIFEPVSEQVQIDTLQQFSEGQPYFFYTGAIHPRKNIPRLIRAFSSFKAATGAPVQLLLGGRFAWHTGEVTDAYNASTYKKDIKILGYINDLDLPRIMGSALALVYPSLSEGFGLPVLEAMQCNVPVLTSNVTALPEVAGDAALLIDPEDETALTNGLIQLWQDAALRNGLVERGKVQRAKFSWDTAADILMDELLFLGNTKNKNA